jgi:hypothetical protein
MQRYSEDPNRILNRWLDGIDANPVLAPGLLGFALIVIVAELCWDEIKKRKWM